MPITKTPQKTQMVKKPNEIINIIKASAIGDIAFEHILGYIREGMTEKQIATEIERVLYACGGTGLAFQTICVAGPNGANPHGIPSDRPIEVGEFLTMDFGTIYNGYCGDMTRTVAIGGATNDMIDIYNIVLEAQLSGLKAIQIGKKCKDIDKTSREIIEQAGYGEYFIHGTGHGVGKEVHESPTLNSKSNEILQENVPITIEPGIYIPNKLGVRIEDLAIVTDFGIINAVKSPKELIIL